MTDSPEDRHTDRRTDAATPRRRPHRAESIVAGVILAAALATAGLITSAKFHATSPPGVPVTLPPSADRSSPPGAAPSPSPSGAMPDRPRTALPDVKPPGFIDPPPGQGLDRYRRQTIAWTDCSVGGTPAQCADIAVPLDYAAPDGQAITLAVLRRPAAGDGSLGPLFINPGGPGQPGRAMAAWLDAATLPGYDLVGWDPRGTGASTPVVCDTDIDALRGHDASPDTPEEQAALLKAWRDFDQSCAAGSGQLLRHIGTADTMADLELLRGLMGGDRLNFLGYSYGTYLGALYADTYPSRVGRMVLDSPVNITDDDSISQVAGFDQAFRRFAQWCVDQSCPLAGSAGGIVTETRAFLTRLDAEPLPVGDRVLTQSLALDGIALALYDDASGYPGLAQALSEAEAGDGANLLQAADAVWGRETNGTYPTWLAAFEAIRCRDEPDDGVTAAFQTWHDDATAAPLFGQFSGPDLTCPLWPVKAQRSPHLTAAGAPPILVVGSTGDSATPYQYARWMTAQMPSTVLLTYDGPGHATYPDRSACIDAAVNAYLNDGTVPAAGTICPG